MGQRPGAGRQTPDARRRTPEVRRQSGERRTRRAVCRMLFLLPALALAARVDTMWVRHYEGSDTVRREWNQAAKVLVDTARNHVFVCGAGEVLYTGNSDMLVAMYNRNGVLLDTVAIGGYMSGGVDMAHSMVLNDSGNLYVVGFTYNYNRGEDVSWVKVPVLGDTFGQITVRKSYWWTGDDVGTDIAVGKTGDIYICGTRNDTRLGLSAFLVMRIRPSDAETVWTRSFFLDTMAWLRQGVERKAKGESRRANGRDLHPEFMEFDFDEFENCATAMAVAPDSNIVVTGFGSHSERARDWWTMKLRPTGDTVWTRTFRNPSTADTIDDDVAFDVAVANTGDVYCVGFTYYDNLAGTRGDWDYTVARYSGSGTLMNSLTRNFTSVNGDDIAFSVVLDDSTPQNVYVTGLLENNNSEQVNTLKLSASLATRWGASGAVYDSPGDDRAYDVGYNAGKVYIAGRRGGSGVGSDDVMLLCYDATNSTTKDTLWSYFYNHPDGLEDYGTSVAATDSNNIYLAGQSLRAGLTYWYSLFLARLFNPRPDASVRRIVAPADTVNLGDTIRPRVVVANTGNTNATFQTYLTIGAVWRDSFLNVNLAPGDSAVDTFSLWVAQPLGAVAVKCTVALAGDTVPANDRLVDTVLVAWRDVACSLLVAPVGEFDSGTTVAPQAWVSNRGSIGLTFDCRMSIGDFYADTQRVTLGSGSSVLINFDSPVLRRRGTWAVVCSTLLDRDRADSNDFRRDSVEVHVTDVGLVAIVAPADTVDSGVLVQPQVRLRNYGTRTADFPVWFMMGYGADTVAYSESLNVTLAPAAETLTVFSTALRPARLGRWYVESWHRLAGDQHPEDDSLDQPLFVRPPGGITWPPGWREVNSMPIGGGRDVKGGGALTVGPSGVYATKGNKTSEFYFYDYVRDSWTTLQPVPAGREGKPCDKGCRIASDGGDNVYLVKGNNTLGFFRYSLADSTWTQLEDVPLGTTGKKVKGGTDMVFVPEGTTEESRNQGFEDCGFGDTIRNPRADFGYVSVKLNAGYVYLLKGYKNEFHRFNTTTGRWETMLPAPGAVQKWDKGSFLVYDNGHTIYAHKSKYNELWRYDCDSARWGAQLTGMPLYNSAGKKKKSKDGGAGAWFQGGIYALKGGNTQEFWRYFAARDSWAELETLPLVGSSQRKKKVKDGGDLVSCAYALWALKGNKSREFWRYGIALRGLGCNPSPEDDFRSGLQSRSCSASRMIPSFRLLTSPLARSVVLVYTGTEATMLTARVYDAAGRLVAIPLTGCKITGPGSVRLSTEELASGVYLLQVTAGEEVLGCKLVVR